MKTPKVSKYDQVYLPTNRIKEYQDIDCRIDGKLKDGIAFIRAYFEENNPIPFAYGFLDENFKVILIAYEESMAIAEIRSRKENPEFYEELDKKSLELQNNNNEDKA